MERNVRLMDVDFARPLIGDAERRAANAVLGGEWLASGTQNLAFEEEFAAYIGVPYAVAVNSGSSANLVALAALNLPKGSKVLTSACGFPATLSPILHLGFEPVLVDYDLETLNIDIDQVYDQLPNVQAVIFAHTLGLPAPTMDIKRKATHLGVAIVEDCCEALGAEVDYAKVGAQGTAGTFSFYPSHHITAAGAGGMVTTRDPEVFKRARSLRDWGKSATWDSSGRNGTSYDTPVDGMNYFPHYVYETVGWNFKLPEVCAAFGREQLKRMPEIVNARLINYTYLDKAVRSTVWDEINFPFWLGTASPFGFPVVLKKGNRNALGNFLESRGVHHRPFFAGNITRHPPFAHLADQGPFPVADFLMKNALFVGCWAGMTSEQLEYVAETLVEGVRKHG
jgi:CDP-6-deoxy-D-xylo-4-hexulose-3-dehydrase